jgi:hypothetical protein
MEDRVELIRAVKPAVLGDAGIVERSVRHAAFQIGAREAPADPVAEPLASFLAKVDRNAYRVVDADIDALRQAGYSDDAILETTLAVAVGAGLYRLERGVAALREDG